MFFFKDSEKEDMKKVLDEMGYSMQNSKDLKRIFTYEFPQVVLERTQKDLKCSSKELDIVKVDFFDYMYTVKEYTHVEMLSSTADVLWHNLILDTKAYMDFCSGYIGFYVHHNPYIINRIHSDFKREEIKSMFYESTRNTDYINYRNNAKRDSTDSMLNSFLLFPILLDIISSPSSSNSNHVSDSSDNTSSQSSCSSSSNSYSSSLSSSCSSSGCGS